MRNKVLIAVSVSVILLIAFIARIIYIDKNELYPNTIMYDMNSEVFFEEDFFDVKENNSSGYSIKILNKEIMDRNEFINEYELNSNDIPEFYKYIFVLTVRFYNHNDKVDTKTGINLSQFILQDHEIMSMAYRDIIPSVNKLNNYTFCLMPNSEIELKIPFCINPEYVSLRQLKKAKLTLVISLYPNKKCIYLS